MKNRSHLPRLAPDDFLPADRANRRNALIIRALVQLRMKASSLPAAATRACGRDTDRDTGGWFVETPRFLSDAPRPSVSVATTLKVPLLHMPNLDVCALRKPLRLCP
jgi:hypothetical protein